MDIHEYQGKQVIAKFGVPVSKGVVITNISQFDDEMKKINSPMYVVKAQIHAGGRGKAGGVKLAKSVAEAKELASQIMGMTLVTPQTGEEGKVVRRIYIEEASDIEKEYYLGIVVDRATSRITVMASTEGGMEIEEVAHESPEKIFKVSIDPATGFQPHHARSLAKGLNFTGDIAKKFAKFVLGCYNAFVATDAAQIEINPMILNTNGDLVALDAKYNLEDNAIYRQAEIAAMRDETEEEPLEKVASDSGLSYIKMHGNIGCMVNGAGLAMSTMDIIKLYGGEPANFLDVGGGATKEKVCTAFKIILSDTNVKAILINIFGGIMRCDIIAEGVIAAAKEVGLSIPLVVRLAGTNFELGKEILNNSGLAIIAADDLADAAEKVVNTLKGA
jgi:succinyl-CoA synthetase beta subunit